MEAIHYSTKHFFKLLPLFNAAVMECIVIVVVGISIKIKIISGLV